MPEFNMSELIAKKAAEIELTEAKEAAAERKAELEDQRKTLDAILARPSAQHYTKLDETAKYMEDLGFNVRWNSVAFEVSVPSEREWSLKLIGSLGKVTNV